MRALACRAALALALLMSLAIVTSPCSAVTAQSPDSGATWDGDPRSISPMASVEASSFRDTSIHHRTDFSSDGTGGMTITRTVRNTDSTEDTGASWGFSLAGTTYSDVRAWDSNGPLVVSTQWESDTYLVTVDFRTPLARDASYTFSFAITISGMAVQSAGDWVANWRTTFGEADQFTRVIYVPSNATITSVTPTPTTRTGTLMTWQVADPAATGFHDIYVKYRLTAGVELPLFLQTAKPWEDDTYGRYPDGDGVNTIRRWGCFLASSTMIVSYWADKQNYAVDNDPGLHNAWARSSGFQGYDVGNIVNHAGIQTYAQSLGVTIFNNHSISGRDDVTLTKYLTAGRPAIIGVDVYYDEEVKRVIPHHFVAATGVTQVNGVDTFAIADPIHGRTTLLDKWNNVYQSILFLSEVEGDYRTITISAHSPVELIVTDPEGRRVGYDPVTNTNYNEIPNASYLVYAIAAQDGSGSSLSPTKTVYIDQPMDGDYQIDVAGTGEGAYQISTSSADWRGRLSQVSYEGNAHLGSADSYSVDYSSATGVYTYVYLPGISN